MSDFIVFAGFIERRGEKHFVATSYYHAPKPPERGDVIPNGQYRITWVSDMRNFGEVEYQGKQLVWHSDFDVGLEAL